MEQDGPHQNNELNNDIGEEEQESLKGLSQSTKDRLDRPSWAHLLMNQC